MDWLLQRGSMGAHYGDSGRSPSNSVCGAGYSQNGRCKQSLAVAFLKGSIYESSRRLERES
jgi:hypothetical protein